jgi:hypothetical protein
MIPGFTLITEAPLWLLILCLAAGALVSLMLYFRHSDQALSRKMTMILALLRFASYSMIAFLLLNPLVKNLIREKELPVIILAMDNSESMMLNQPDTSRAAAMLRDAVKSMTEELGNNYTVESYTFGESVNDTIPIHFGEKETDIASLLSMTETRYAGRNAGALIMVSDGIYNRGFNPMSLLDRISIPVFTARWGDTTMKRDLVLAEVNYNKVAYLGNTFPLEIVVKGIRCNNLNTRLVVRNREKVLVSQPLSITGDLFSKVIPLKLNAEKEGIMDLDILLEPVPDEITTINNRSRAFIEVLSGKKKILILASKPHPDLGAISNALLQNNVVESDVVMLSDLKSPVQSYDLIIMHQLPDDQRSADILNKCVAERIPVLLIAGGKTRMDLISAAGAGPGFNPGKLSGQQNEVLGVMNPGFALFTPPADFTDQLPVLPPLIVPFGKFESKPGEQILTYQRIGNVPTSYPLISFYQMQGCRAGFIAGEGIWKWRMFSFRNTKSHTAFDTFLNQFIQYLTADEEKSRFRITTKSFVPENQPVIFNAELYNAAFAPVVDPEVKLEVMSSDGKKFDYILSRKETFYQLEVGKLPVGEYSYRSTVTLGSEKFSASGRFVVAPVQIETSVTMADHNLLRGISAVTGAISVPADQWVRIIKEIKSRNDIKPVSHLRVKFSDLTTLFWLLLALLLLLGTEWFLRKWSGTY